MASSSSSSSSLPFGEYDVFLSFRGEDVRKTFVDHLYKALVQEGIKTFKDDEELERGKSISPELVKNINVSTIAVIVFSENYASSPWCLDELVEILKCSKTKGQTVLPIFYHVKPSQVRHQKRSFSEAFSKHEEIHKEDMEKVQRWRASLKEAADIGGLDLEDAANGYENKFIKKIVQVILEKLQPKPFFVADYEVGIDARVNKIITLLDENQLFVGICGIGGAGKTTLAKAVFNRISKKFERVCFLPNVREQSTKHDGVAKLQSDLLRQTLMDDNITILYPDRGINQIKDRLRNKMLLLVLDDIDQEGTLKYLVGVGHEWLGIGSRIIITTRDKRLLEKYNVKTYDLELLNHSETLQLFSWHAFKQKKPEDDYEELSNRAKAYAKGLPLALKVLGSLLHKRSKPQWLSILDRLKTNPPKEIHDVLRISYDGLDKEEKDIFLDIACFFKGYDKECVMNVYKRDELDPVIGIQILSERCLINISEHNIVSMHDLIQEMGREIVHQESEDPGKRSRLWSYEDIYEIFTQNTMTENIEAIIVPKDGLSLEDLDFFGEGLHVRADAFAKMRKLRILKIDSVQLDGCLTYLSNELRYLDWSGYPEEYLPNNFRPKKLVQLHLRNSLIKGIRTNIKFLKMLKVLDLSDCKNLGEKNLNFSGFSLLEKLFLKGCENLVEVEFDDKEILDKLKMVVLRDCKNLKKTPNLSRLPCLEVLNVEGCTNLIEVHPSIEFHESLVKLDFRYCKNLKNLATRINLKSLKKLLLSGCSKLEKFPEIYGHMECLESLWLIETAIKELPPSIVKHLKGLKELDLSRCKMLGSLPNNIGEMKNLGYLWLGQTAIKDLPPSVQQLKGLAWLDLSGWKMFESLPNYVGEMKSLRILTLNGTDIKKLPSSIAQLTSLTDLSWKKCDLDEESILNLPHSLTELDLSGNNFVSLPASFTQLTNLRNLDLNGCLRLQTLDSLPSSIRQVTAEGCISLERYWIPTSNISYRSFDFVECRKLVENQWNNKPNIYYYSESELLQEFHGIQMVLPGSEIPSWFSYIKYENDSKSGDQDMTWVCLRIDRDPNSLRYLAGVYVCAVIGIDHQPSSEDHEERSSDNHYYLEFAITLRINDHSKYCCRPGNYLIENIKSDHIVLFGARFYNWEYIAALITGHRISNGCYIEALITGHRHSNGQSLKVKKWGIHPIMATKDEDVQYDEDVQ